VEGDIEPGFVLSTGENRAGRWLMAIKPGGFGSDGCWVKAFDTLEAGRVMTV
jgi:hypothetical protein